MLKGVMQSGGKGVWADIDGLTDAHPLLGRGIQLNTLMSEGCVWICALCMSDGSFVVRLLSLPLVPLDPSSIGLSIFLDLPYWLLAL